MPADGARALCTCMSGAVSIIIGTSKPPLKEVLTELEIVNSYASI